MSNSFKAKAHVKETRIIYTYMYDNKEYEIETPRTPLNEGVTDGEIVLVHLAVLPIEKELEPADVIVHPVEE